MVLLDLGFYLKVKLRLMLLIECEEVVDTTGCGDTYMAAYVSHRLKNCSIEESGNFASRIASEKLKRSGHY